MSAFAVGAHAWAETAMLTPAGAPVGTADSPDAATGLAQPAISEMTSVATPLGANERADGRALLSMAFTTAPLALK